MLEIHGHLEPEFDGVREQLIKQIKYFGGGAAASVYYEGEKVVDIWGGISSNDGKDWEEDTRSLVWSTTKAVPATLLHMLVSDGLIEYDKPVSDYWPEFAQEGKERITVRQLLSHQAGLYQVRGLIERPSDILDWDNMVDALAGIPPLHKPGKANGYHAFNIGWLLGALIEKVSGKSFKEFLHTRLQEPLDLKGLVIGAEDEELENLADIMGMPSLFEESKIKDRYYVPSYVPRGMLRRLVSRGITPRRMWRYLGDPDFYKATIPAVNGTFDARSLAKMYAMLANMGEFEGKRYIDEDVVEKAREVQTTRFDKVTIYPLHWRLGYHRADAITEKHPEAFGHYGFGGAGGWANPEEKLAFGLVHNGNPMSVLGQVRCVAMTGSVYEGARKAG
jgi:CubicO group peptidase (beta-lactamase class C family)